MGSAAVARKGLPRGGFKLRASKALGLYSVGLQDQVWKSQKSVRHTARGSFIMFGVIVVRIIAATAGMPSIRVLSWFIA